MKKTVLALTAAAVFTTGCQSPNPYTGESEFNKTSKYGGIGALAGAAVGALANGKRGALAGAAIGAAAGAGWGYYVDRQEDALRQHLRSTGVKVVRNGDQLSLIMPGNITFNTDSYNIQAGFYRTLNSVGMVLREFDQSVVEVVGHTDSTGGRAHNMQLSENRARSVSSYLINQGVLANRVRYYGVGPDRPIASNGNPQGRAQNRRVEINLLPMSGVQY
ncbi:OmpA family protein [Zooshikella marina]|uniref:OmpA family protein n=1 Tax=Zooshikella ganghwensis TaxID=202772 RepID=A0A4P9VL25_9GAMM|nr:OmpA family protein [Zooshikella ganghwensis]MBU2708315.1 OmpA family protein [Zooshikella ganghwensis]RDH44038.1 OmpA family protein [Zooshikella ganghwensis]